MRFAAIILAIAGCHPADQPAETAKPDNEHADIRPESVKLVAIDRTEQTARLAAFTSRMKKDWLIFFDAEPKPKQFGRFLASGVTTVQILDKRSILAELIFPAKKVAGVWEGNAASVELQKCYVVITDIDTSKAIAGLPVPNAAISTVFEVVGFHEQKMTDGTTKKLPQLQPVPKAVVDAAAAQD